MSENSHGRDPSGPGSCLTAEPQSVSGHSPCDPSRGPAAQYSNEAIASGLLDAAGWLENDGWISKHIRTIRLAAERLRERGETTLATVTADELAEMDALSAAATPGIWGVYEQAIRDQRDPIRELTDLVWATKPLGENLYMLEAGGKCPATTGCSALSGANAKFIAALVNGYRSGHLRPAPQGIEARSAETSGLAEGESPVAEGDAPAKSEQTDGVEA